MQRAIEASHPTRTLSAAAIEAYQQEASIVRSASERFPHMRADEEVSLRQLWGWWLLMGDAGLPHHRARHPGHRC